MHQNYHDIKREAANFQPDIVCLKQINGIFTPKALKAGNLAFASMFVISVLAIIIQMLLTVDIRLVLGETATALVGGILYASIMVYNGIWDKCLPKSATIWRDFLTSVICAGIFTVIYGICLFRMGATEFLLPKQLLSLLKPSEYPQLITSE